MYVLYCITRRRRVKKVVKVQDYTRINEWKRCALAKVVKVQDYTRINEWKRCALASVTISLTLHSLYLNWFTVFLFTRVIKYYAALYTVTMLDKHIIREAIWETIIIVRYITQWISAFAFSKDKTEVLRYSAYKLLKNLFLYAAIWYR